MDYRVQIAIVIAAGGIIALLMVRRIFTKGSLHVNKRGLKGSLEGNPNAAPPAEGVDLSDAEFRDQNKFKATSDARVKAPGMRAGSKNEFTFGESSSPDERGK